MRTPPQTQKSLAFRGRSTAMCTDGTVHQAYITFNPGTLNHRVVKKRQKDRKQEALEMPAAPYTTAL